MNLYNEIDNYAADWLESLIEVGMLPPGTVDRRDIRDIKPGDLHGYTQCHFFAGIGGWAQALALAGVSERRPLWTGSCPCQPFSTAGRGKGTSDERHVWPWFHWLMEQCRPPIVFGEQVASPAGREWLAGVQTDVEALDYTTAAADLCAAGVGAPHIRQRLFWVAESSSERLQRECLQLRERESRQHLSEAARCSTDDRVADAAGERQHRSEDTTGATGRRSTEDGRTASRVGDTGSAGAGRYAGAVPGTQEKSKGERIQAWDIADCTVVAGADGKQRRIKSGLEPLADGISGRVGMLRGYGNAIVPQVAATFIGAYFDVT